MVTNVELGTQEGGCGMSLPIIADLSIETISPVARIVVEDALSTLTRLNRPLVFEMYCDRNNGLVGWRV